MAISNLFGWNKDIRETAPSSACGSACGASDKPAEEKPTACGSACGSGDK